ncbi:copper metallochaperone COX17 KNAG_0H02530 [Huiozyma naganishii CBS 8797]|uniref:Cytochrome c oxidase copper chaperone n=1 Tax=Huiozyma naganishii (strain ATCC MYA-139 / BCRC 22969 / CBS 8797 / KCTC 17520 / NBRC 10181 / NCYC 3082 / Yp74L-3) TaxID=1071383 RepID=J7RPL3_HUIN7|nr:hypothetical protein KNAG_0H02530 [Kazachstania naganishii CBS 8797]CCK71668.1 hypothetical protein KNAG_0H02530 [Kazachstania naganishii CBS 8797]
MSEPVDQSKVSVDKEERPKACCVCKDEKSARDECLLFKGTADDSGYVKCKDLIEKYKSCMKGHGFEVK